MARAKTAIQRLEEFWTTPPINYFNSLKLTNQEKDSLYELILACHQYQMATRLPAVDFLKLKLGKQDYCWDGEFRFHVWEIEKKARIFASNTKGICLEVAEGLSKKELFDILHEVDQKLKL